jgi:hypothetical protein
VEVDKEDYIAQIELVGAGHGVVVSIIVLRVYF